MRPLTLIPRWAKRTLAAFLLAGALAAPLIAAQVQPAASQTAQTAHGALAVVPHPHCPGSPVGC